MKWATTILIFCVAVLVGLGMVMLYSSSMNMEMGKTALAPSHFVGASFLLSQLVWCLLGLIGCVVVASSDYRRIKKLTPWILGVASVLLVLVFVHGIGISRNGGRRWIGFGHLPHFQPSELAKLALILFLAFYGERYQRHMSGFKKGLLIPGCVVLPVLALIFFEPDRGCTILLIAVCGVTLVLAGVRLSYIFVPGVLLAGGLALSLLHDPMRLRRIMAWIHPEQNKDGVGYQAYEAMIALGSGGWFGLGLGNGRQKLGFIPEHHTDFIFSIIGEELGLVTTLAVLLLFVALVACGIYIARRSTDTFGLLLGAGITFMIGLQAFINMGVVTSLLPNKGMPLPFISYGGSNLLLMLVCVGFLLSIARFAAEPVEKKVNPFESVPEKTHA
ncbi:MAG TPA: putative lipid II flippase FtsW [Verrucomicrobiae bacterium]|jgi:cell division protein FtsW|nr:putative lipid II flippase FtsW [Verrucomicrobiae bacterium]